MPKAGSGFMRAAGSAANTLQRGSPGRWRLENPGDYTEEIRETYRFLYRSGMVIQRDRRGQFVDYKSTDRSLDAAYARLQNLAERIAGHVQ